VLQAIRMFPVKRPQEVWHAYVVSAQEWGA
jgi:hypothetical protein